MVSAQAGSSVRSNITYCSHSMGLGIFTKVLLSLQQSGSASFVVAEGREEVD